MLKMGLSRSCSFEFTEISLPGEMLSTIEHNYDKRKNDDSRI